MANYISNVSSPKFDWETNSDLAVELKKFKRYTELLLTTPEFKDVTATEKINYILLWMGPKAIEIYDQNIAADNKTSPENLFKGFQKYFEPKNNFRLSRFKFHKMKQTENETIDQFFTRMKVEADRCKFKDTETINDNIVDQIIIGTVHDPIRKKLLEVDPDKLDLNKTLDICRTYEVTKTQLEEFKSSDEGAVGGTMESDVQKIDAMRQFTNRAQQKGNTHKYGNISSKERYSNDGKRKPIPGKNFSCYYCAGPKHSRDQCPARDAACSKCQIIGHFGKACRKSKMQQYPRAGIRTIEYDNNDEYDYEYDVNFDQLTFSDINVNSIVDMKISAMAKIQIEPQTGVVVNLKGKADTGAQGNILPLRVFQKIYPHLINDKGYPMNVKKSNITLSAYNGGLIQQYGVIEIPCKYKLSKWLKVPFFIVDTNKSIIFGIKTCTDLGLVTMNCWDDFNEINVRNTDFIQSKPVNEPNTVKHIGTDNVTSECIEKVMQCDIIKTPEYNENVPHVDLPKIANVDELKKMYPDRFQGLGKFEGTCKLTLKDNVTPVRHPPRRAPIQLHDKIKNELQRMLDLGVIRKVDEPTDWVSSITYRHKNDGSLRICLDPKPLNKALKRAEHHTPTLEELTHRFHGAKFFSKLDARSGYWSIQLDSESQILTTFNSPFGRYCFMRLPFGISTAQDSFQASMDMNLEGLKGVASITDDIVVYGDDEKDHDINLHNLMIRAKEKGIIFNAPKCFIKQKSVKFYGHVYGTDGVRPDPDKVKAIVDLEAPSDTKELQHFLGLITYLSEYIPKLSENTRPLRALLKKDIEYQWNHEQQEAFLKLKELICEANTLAYFDPNKPAIIQVDASKYALGAVLIQEQKPIAFASKSLKPAESNYFNIEREALACLFGAQKFHTYVYGKPFIIESDHKPLDMIAKKSLNAAPARLQSMFLDLQKYDFDIKYRPGKEMILADSLTRIKKAESDDDREMPIKHQVICLIQFSSQKLDELRENTTSDKDLNKLMEYINNGFPQRYRDLPQHLRQYWAFRDELSIEDGLIIKGEQVVIPTTKRNEYLNKIHEGHFGISRCQQRAKSSIYWPGINKDIIDLIGQCLPCQTHQRSQSKQPMEPIMSNIPNIAWHTIGSDLFSLDNKDYIVIGDYFSKYPFVENIRNSTSETITRITNKIFSQFGIPNTIISDNGPCFIGQPYQTLMKQHGIKHVTSSPHYPKSHGFIERLVSTAKALIKKNPNKMESSLLQYRTSPIGNNLPSPGELLFNRKIQGNLPIHTKGFQNDEVREKLLKNQQKSIKYYNRGAHDLKELNMGNNIFYQDIAKRNWIPGIITGYGPEPRSYTIRCEITGKFLRRNRIHIRPRNIDIYAPPHQTKEPYPAKQDYPEPQTYIPLKFRRIQQRPEDIVTHNQAPARRSNRNIVKPQRLVENML